MKTTSNEIKTFDDVLKVNGKTQAEFDSETANDSVDEKAYKQAKLIAKALNEEWRADFNDPNQYKYYPYGYAKEDRSHRTGFGFSFTSYLCTDTFTDVGSRLCFRSAELAMYAINQFEEVYKNLWF